MWYFPCAGRLWEADCVVFESSGRLWAAQSVVFHVSGEINLSYFACLEGFGRLDLFYFTYLEGFRTLNLLYFTCLEGSDGAPLVVFYVCWKVMGGKVSRIVNAARRPADPVKSCQCFILRGLIAPRLADFRALAPIGARGFI